MENSALAIQLLLLGSAVPVGLEAYKASKPRGFYTLWTITALMVVVGIFFPAIAGMWPVAGTALTSLASNPTTWFTLVVGLFFVLRPFWRRPEVSPTSPSGGRNIASIYDDTKLRAEVADLAKTVRAVIDDYQRMNGLELRLTDQLDGFKTYVRDEFESIRQGVAVVESKANDAVGLAAKVEEIRVDVALAIRDIEKMSAAIEKETKGRQHALYAIYARERMADLAAQIRGDARTLYDPVKSGQVYDTAMWNQWEAVHAQWESNLNSWTDLAQWYAPPGFVKSICTVDDREYSGPWTIPDERFPTAEAVRRFRKHRIIMFHWEEAQPKITQGVIGGAYLGMSEEALRNG